MYIAISVAEQKPTAYQNLLFLSKQDNKHKNN